MLRSHLQQAILDGVAANGTHEEGAKNLFAHDFRDEITTGGLSSYQKLDEWCAKHCLTYLAFERHGETIVRFISL